MSYLLVQILVCLLIAGLIGLAIGWLLRGGCSGKLKENDNHWNEQLNHKVQGLMLEKKREVGNVQDRLSLISKNLKVSEDKNRLLVSEQDKLVIELNETIDGLKNRLSHSENQAKTNELKLNQKLKATEDGWKSKVQGLMSQGADSKAQAEKILAELKGQLAKAEDELKANQEALKRSNSEWSLKLQAREKELTESENNWQNKVQGLMSQESESKAQRDNELTELKEQLAKAENQAKVNQDALDTSSSEWSLKLQESEKSWKSKIQGLMTQGADSKAQSEKALAELKGRLVKAEDEVKANQEALKKKNNEWSLKLQTREKELKESENNWQNKVQGLMSQESESKAQRDNELAELKEQLAKVEEKAKDINRENQELDNKLKASEEKWMLQIKSLEKQISKEKNEVEVSKNKLFSSNNEFNKNLAKAQQAHREREAQQRETILSLQKRIALIEKEANENEDVNNLKKQLSKLQLELKSNQEILDKSNSEWSLKLQNREKELDNLKNSLAISKAELESRELELNKKLKESENNWQTKVQGLKSQEAESKAQKERELEELKGQLTKAQLEVKANQEALDKSNSEWSLKLQNREKELNSSKKPEEHDASEDTLSFNLKRNTHKTKAKGRHVQRNKKKNIQSKEVVTNSTKDSSEKVTKDNLQLIKGIGKVLEKTLHSMNIYTFKEISEWDDEKVATINKSLSFSGRIEREEWVQQATLLASGTKTEFSERVKKGEVPTSKK